MTSPFVGEIRAVAYNFAPVGWAFCNGQVLPIMQNTALFSLLGTTYGGDGKTTFALPNLQGASPIHPGQGPGLSLIDLGEMSGTDTVTLLQTEIPVHSHSVGVVDSSGTSGSPLAGAPATARYGRAGEKLYASSPDSSTFMSPFTLNPTGGGLPHNNMPPYLVLNFIIALQGVFPPRG